MSEGLRVAVTGPTGDIGHALLRALQRNDEVAEIVGMARREFDPEAHGLTKLDYRRGDVTDRSDVDDLVKGADVVVHLAFMIFGDPEEAREVNLAGCRNVFEAAIEEGVERLVYASSVAAYGFYEENPTPLTEDVPARGSPDHFYSQQKADIEEMLENLTAGVPAKTYVFRPCIVAGPSALALIQKIPYVQLAEKVPEAVRKLAGTIPLLRPVIPDPGIPIQLVHEDDVARAFVAAITGEGPPGAYNLAAEGEIYLSDLAHALGWYSIPVPELALDATARIVSWLPYLPPEARWLNAMRVPVLMDSTKARTELGWQPKFDALETLAETVAGARSAGLLPWRTRKPSEI